VINKIDGDLATFEDRVAKQLLRRRLLIATAALVVVALVAVLAVILTRSGPHHRTAPAPAPPAGSSAPAPSGAPSAGTAADLSTMTLDGGTLPVSRIAGPHTISADGGQASGFAKTPLGAALAAVHLGYRLEPNLGPRVFLPALSQIPAAHREEIRQQLLGKYTDAARAAGITGGGPLPATGPVPDYLGWRLDEFSTTRPVTVHVEALTPGTNARLDAPLTVEWSGSDWQLVPPLLSSVSPVSDPSAYTAF